MPVNRASMVALCVCAAACLTQAAGATELNNGPAATVQQQQPDWAGFYLRSNGTTGSDTLPWAFGSQAGFSSNTHGSPTNTSFGYNFQSGNFVFGVEGSLAAANFDGRFTSPYLPSSGAWTPNMNWLGTVTGKVGYSFGQWLPYVRGGFAAGELGSPLQGAPIGSFSQSSQVGGWTAGVGLEYNISQKWSLGLEYLYSDLSNSGGNGVNGGAPINGSPEMYSTALKSQSLLGRLNYKTGW
jgi:outer membrane immunogenic protein